MPISVQPVQVPLEMQLHQSGLPPLHPLMISVSNSVLRTQTFINDLHKVLRNNVWKDVRFHTMLGDISAVNLEAGE